MVYLEVAVVLVLILANGLLAMSELAVVSARPARLKAFNERGIPAAKALALASDPGRFLSSVQVGITLVGILSGAFSGATLGLRLTHKLMAAGLPENLAETLGVGSVVAVLTYVSLIVGELVPKQIALRDPERMAIRVAPAMTILAEIGSPLVSFLDGSGKFILRLLGLHEAQASKVTDEEIHTVIAEAETAGVLASDERRLIAGVMRLGDRAVRGVMTPRTEIDWIDLALPKQEIRQKLLSTRHSRLPVGDTIDGLSGVVQVRELFATILADGPLDLAAHVHPAPVVYVDADALDVFAVLRSAEVPLALVHDEYGQFHGIVTPADILEAIAGAFRSDAGAHDPPAVRREDGSWLLSGSLPTDELADLLGITLPTSRDYQTTAGFALSVLRRLPATGDRFEALGWTFEIVDMDGRRVDKILAQRQPAIEQPVGIL